jgi:hypothetical protein
MEGVTNQSHGKLNTVNMKPLRYALVIPAVFIATGVTALIW